MLEFSILLRVSNVFIILVFYLINIKIAFSFCRSVDHLMSVRPKVCRYLLALLFASRCALETHTNEKRPLCFEIRSTAQPEAKDPASGVKPWKRGTASGTCGWSGPIVSVSSSGSAGSGDKTFPLNAAIFQLFSVGKVRRFAPPLVHASYYTGYWRSNSQCKRKEKFLFANSNTQLH